MLSGPKAESQNISLVIAKWRQRLLCIVSIFSVMCEKWTKWLKLAWILQLVACKQIYLKS